MTRCFTIQGFAVDLIRELWDRGLYQDNECLQAISKEWFGYWVDYRTCLTMEDVDAQIEELVQPTEVAKPLFTEIKEGESPLGGMMRLRAPWIDE